MSEKEAMILLSKVLTQPGTKGNNQRYIDIIIQEDIPVLCVNKGAQKTRLMPFKVLFDNNENFWHKAGTWEYFFTSEGYSKLKDKLTARTAPAVIKTEEKKEDAIEEMESAEESAEVGFGKDYKTFSEMTTEEKIDCLNNDKKRLNDILAQKTKDEAEVTEILVDTTKDAALINHAALEEAIKLADDEAKKLTQDLVDSTNEMVKSSAQLISENVFSNEMMNSLVEKSNGTIIQHMTRVYLNGLAFLSYYNNLVSTSSAIQKLRIKFASEYRKFYHELLPHLSMEDIVLERVFYGGMRAIPTDLFFKWAVGFLIHDIGKANAVEYHEGEAKYDRKIVIDHVKQGYKSIMTKTNYPMEASLITGYHHEYYGDADGYGYFRAYLSQYKKQNPNATQDYCITYELEPILDYQALAYFPAKVLEIIDIYDSVTDPHRVYRKSMTPDEALAMMKEEFVVKHKKIDAILFDIFEAFIREKEKQNKGKSVKIAA
ncbi:MAG: metal-dependent phosphohydrolase [Treponema sp.]|nr:metal-dependent phosphohydrolase [Treponema sp.]MCL2237077.1 metal-dependent phosphohydrolase [Treponema sp.]